MTNMVRPVEWGEEVGQRIAEARKRIGLSQAELADLLVLHPKSITNYEGGRIPWREMPRMAEVLNVDLRWLLHGESYQDPLETLAAEIAGLRRAIEDLVAQAVEIELEQEPAARDARRGSGSAGASSGTGR